MRPDLPEPVFDRVRYELELELTLQAVERCIVVCKVMGLEVYITMVRLLDDIAQRRAKSSDERSYDIPVDLWLLHTHKQIHKHQTGEFKP